ncbi:hypothetical protein R3W88_019597 [Solanum pinnatisectum]|uniref:Uncharacterized protein n=1 Tax=Solanum pinnatisectum TaxID=50273 RepID=A0AAV9KMM9_9SOLN|nr:hypothetical protein R3W88_019597 [Solanum pinnatisectum]
MMVTREMLKNDFISSQGLGVIFDGIVEQIQLSGQNIQVSLANLKSKGDIPLTQPISHLNQSFSKVCVTQESEEVAENNLVEGLKNLFTEEAKYNMILEDCTEAPTIWDAKPRDALNN